MEATISFKTPGVHQTPTRQRYATSTELIRAIGWMICKNIREKATGTVNSIANTPLQTKLSKEVLFQASFLEGEVVTQLIPDSDADANLMPSTVLKQITSKAPKT